MENQNTNLPLLPLRKVLKGVQVAAMAFAISILISVFYWVYFIFLSDSILKINNIEKEIIFIIVAVLASIAFVGYFTLIYSITLGKSLKSTANPENLSSHSMLKNYMASIGLLSLLSFVAFVFLLFYLLF